MPAIVSIEFEELPLYLQEQDIWLDCHMRGEALVEVDDDGSMEVIEIRLPGTSPASRSTPLTLTKGQVPGNVGPLWEGLRRALLYPGHGYRDMVSERAESYLPRERNEHLLGRYELLGR